MTEIVNSKPEFYDEATDVDRLNLLLDAITAKRFVSPIIFAQAVRGACDLHGITLPLLDIEGGNGPSVEDGKFVLAGISDPKNPNMYAPPDECEHTFHVEDGDGDISDIYLYVVCDKDLESGYYECYAQLVNEEELHDVLNMDEKDFPEVDDTESNYLKQTRHARSGIAGDVLDDMPPQD